MSDNEKKGGRPLTSPDYVIENVTGDKPAISGRSDNEKNPLQFLFPEFTILPPLPDWFIEKITKNTSAMVGRDIDADSLIRIGELERCRGLYVLGQPRTGKSNLLISVALADIQNGHGVLFIDPHTDAVNDLLARIPQERYKDIIFLDPTHKTRSFGINLLHCADPTDPIELDNTVGRVLDIFAKVWGDSSTGRLGIWLEKILANSVYLLLENPGYTLVDIPPLLWEDTAFRNELLKNVSVKSSVPDFWYNEFDRLTRRDKTEQVGPALSRLDIFRRNDMIRGIVGQKTSTVDFSEILKEQKIVLLRMPVNLSGEVKNLIGTMLLSEVLYAVFERAKRAEKERPFFGIYCDEFQEFATPDFARLFTQTGKYKVMPVVAHQTRRGQFKPGDPNQGATLDSPNKVLFALSSYDARELALDFASAPPNETRREQELVICQDPVSDLLRRPPRNPDIQAFVTEYLRFLEDKRDDIKADMEGEKFARMVDLDTAGLYGAEAQEEGVVGGSHIADQITAINARQSAILSARMHSIKLVALHKQSNRIRVTMRELNRFLTEVMKGNKRARQEAFSDFLISLAAGYSALPEAFAEALGLYIKLSYGDPNAARAIPSAFAQKYGVFQAVVAQVQRQEEIKRKKEEDVRYERYIARWEEDRNIRESIRRGRARELWPRLMNYRLRFNTGWLSLVDDLLKPFLLMCARPSLQKALAPYLTARFAGTWKEAYKKWSASIPRDVLERLEYVRNDDGRDHYNMGYSRRDRVHFTAHFLDSFKEFFQKYKEGGVVALALVNIAGYPKWCTWDLEGMIGDEGYYPDFNVLYLPAIENRKPLDLLLFLEELTEPLSGIKCETECAKFYESSAGTNPYHRKEREMRDGRECETDLDNLVRYGAHAGEFTRWIERRAALKEIKEVIGLNVWREHLDIAKNKWWDKSTGLIKAYLIARACDTVRFGKEVADVTFPQPDVNGATTKEMAEFVASLVKMVRHKEKYREWPNYVPHLVVPEHLDPRVLSGQETRAVREACIEENKHGPEVVYKVAGTIDAFARFCVLLAKPENHILVPSGQYIEKQVPLRQESDMVNEMARVLTSLPRYTAYARVVDEKRGEPIVWKGRIRTAKLTDAAVEGLMRRAAQLRKMRCGTAAGGKR